MENNNIINKLNIKEKIAQMLIIPISEEKITDETANFIKEYKPGGFILYKKNYKNYEEMLEIVNKLKEYNFKNDIPLFISIDQEGGRVNRFTNEIKNIKSANKIASTKDLTKVRESSDIISIMLDNTGINMNFAPVLDIKRFNELQAIGDRCYGNNPESISAFGLEFINAHKINNVIPIIKHFPGHGLTNKDSHFFLPKVKVNMDTIEQEDLLPFEWAIKNGADAVMISHIIIKNIDKKYPSSLSKKIIHRYLINKYNFKGLIITDDLKMLAIRLKYSPKKAAKLAIDAGNNIIVLGYNYKSIKDVIDYIAKCVENNKIKIEKIDESVKKILEIKEKYNISDKNAEGMDINSINSRIQELNNSIE